MNLRQTILGLLSWKSASGYDLKRIISESDVFYWSGNNNQIYKCLIELQNEGMVTCQTQLQTGLPNKKIYTITQQGLAELRDGLTQAVEQPALQKDILIHLAWAEMLADGEILLLLDNYEEELRVRIKMFELRASRPSNQPNRSEREKYLWLHIADNLIVTYQTELKWVKRVREDLRTKTYRNGK